MGLLALEDEYLVQRDPLHLDMHMTSCITNIDLSQANSDSYGFLLLKAAPSG